MSLALQVFCPVSPPAAPRVQFGNCNSKEQAEAWRGRAKTVPSGMRYVEINMQRSRLLGGVLPKMVGRGGGGSGRASARRKKKQQKRKKTSKVGACRCIL